MRLNHGMFALVLSASALGSTVAITGCAGSGVVYPYGSNYRRWGPGEDRYYRRWEVQTHRSHIDFQRRSRGEQNAYWGWRHR